MVAGGRSRDGEGSSLRDRPSLVEERIRLFYVYLGVGMTVDEAWSQACLDAGTEPSPPRGPRPCR